MHQRRLAATLTVVLAATVPTFAQEPGRPSPSLPELAGGTVTLPYAELRALLLAAQAPKPPPPEPPPAPPVPFRVGSARFALEVDPEGRSVRGRATFEVQTFAPTGWTAVPLLPAGDARLTGVEPAGALVAVRDDALALLVDKPGSQTVTLVFTAPLAENGRFTLRSATPALVNQVTVTNVPAGQLVEIAGAERDHAANGAFHLAAGQPIALALVREEDRRPAPAPVPSVWRVAAEALVGFDDGRLVYRTRLRAAADAGSGVALELALPAAAGVLRVDGGPDLARWRVEKSADGRERRLFVTWKTADLLRRELFVDYELPQPTPEGDWPLVVPVAVPPGGSTAPPADAPAPVFTLALPDGLEFPGALPGDARTAPRWLAALLGGGPFVTLPPSATAAPVAQARRLPRVQTAPATVEEAGYRTRLVADGATLTEGKLAVRHDGPLPFVVSLPPGAALLACAVNDRETFPVDRGAGRVEIALPAGAGGGKTLTRVTFTSTGRIAAAPLAPVAGQAALALPQTDLFTQTLRWDLQIPDAYELTALDGNVELLPAKDTADLVIHLRKELLRGERPVAELFYQKKTATP